MSSQTFTASAQSQSAKNYAKAGDLSYNRMEKVNSELLALTYGSLVTQLLKDVEDISTVNDMLERMGFSMGSRLVEEFLARSGMSGCVDFREVVEVLAKVGFKIFLGVTAEVAQWNSEASACSLIFTDNPLADFVELPPSMIGKLKYSNLICGVIRGAMEQLFMRVKCELVKDILNGDPHNEIELEFVELLREEFIDEEEDGTSR